SITIGNDGEDFRKQLDKYDRFAHYSLRANSGEATYRALEENLKDYNTVVVGIMDVSNNPKRNYGIKQKDIDFIKKLSEKCNVITILFGNSYAARYIDELPHALVAYEENEFTEKLVPQIIFGGRSANGKIPVTVSSKLRAGTGWDLEKMNRMGYSSPESHGMD